MNREKFEQPTGGEEQEPTTPEFEDASEGDVEDGPQSRERIGFGRQKGPSQEELEELARDRFGSPENAPGGFGEEDLKAAKAARANSQIRESIVDFRSSSHARHTVEVINQTTQQGGKEASQ